MLPRKIISAAIAGALYAVLFSLIVPNPLDINSISKYIWSFIMATPVYLIYSFPVILIYGTLTSTLSDYLSKFISNNKDSKKEIYISFLFHLLFGLILLWVSLIASIIYFLVDRFLIKKSNIYKWRQAFKSLTIPFLLWGLFMGIIWLMDFVKNWTDYIVY
jgi:hypothetical protein